MFPMIHDTLNSLDFTCHRRQLASCSQRSSIRATAQSTESMYVTLRISSTASPNNNDRLHHFVQASCFLLSRENWCEPYNDMIENIIYINLKYSCSIERWTYLIAATSASNTTFTFTSMLIQIEWIKFIISLRIPIKWKGNMMKYVGTHFFKSILCTSLVLSPTVSLKDGPPEIKICSQASIILWYKFESDSNFDVSPLFLKSHFWSIQCASIWNIEFVLMMKNTAESFWKPFYSFCKTYFRLGKISLFLEIIQHQ